jgi:hypothetical protein
MKLNKDDVKRLIQWGDSADLGDRADEDLYDRLKAELESWRTDDGDQDYHDVEDGWCDANGVEHAWEVQGYTLTSDPPQSVRICLNCGKKETRANTVTLPEWR